MSDPESPMLGFSQLNLPAALEKAILATGYESPTPIQAQAIPVLLAGHDLLGHAPTGTGKTAAFALPLLARVDIKNPNVQILTLAPTRELAIQVAEAFQRYAAHIPGFHVLPIYGGQDYGGQLRALKRGAHVVVGTPGRVMDHIRNKKLVLNDLQALVLDEADEMLRMGFIDDVEWILEQAPEKRQMALFSATMPPQIEKIARRHMNKPQEISIKSSTATAATIRQRYWRVSGMHKLDALTRILEFETFDGMLIFVRTRIATVELAEKLQARGHAAAAMNGDMAQAQREQMVGKLKRGQLDILVATDVAARGLDVDRISHVVNYDIPHDCEAYIHRIGRTGRAGRQGDAILFVAPREQRMLQNIERATRQKIEVLQLPSAEAVNDKRIGDFKQKIVDSMGGDLTLYRDIVTQLQQEQGLAAEEIAAALARMATGDKPLLLAPDKPAKSAKKDNNHKDSKPRTASADADRGGDRPVRKVRDDSAGKSEPRSRGKSRGSMEKFRVEVGHEHGVKPANIVAAIANEAGVDPKHIGYIDIDKNFSTIDLPPGMPEEIFNDLRTVKVCGKELNLSRMDEPADDRKQRTKGKRKPVKGKKKGGKPAGKKPAEAKRRTKPD